MQVAAAPQFVIIYCYCCRQAQQPVLFCKHSSDPEKSVQHLCNIIVITQIVCTFLLNGGMTKTDQPVPRLCYCFLYTHLSPLCPLSRCQDFFCILQGTWAKLPNFCSELSFLAKVSNFYYICMSFKKID